MRLSSSSLFIPNADLWRKACVFGDFSIFGELHHANLTPLTPKSTAKTFVQMQNFASTPMTVILTWLSNSCSATFTCKSKVHLNRGILSKTTEELEIILEHSHNCLNETRIHLCLNTFHWLASHFLFVKTFSY